MQDIFGQKQNDLSNEQNDHVESGTATQQKQGFEPQLRLRKRIQERVKTQTSAESEMIITSLFIGAPLSGMSYHATLTGRYAT